MSADESLVQLQTEEDHFEIRSMVKPEVWIRTDSPVSVEDAR